MRTLLSLISFIVCTAAIPVCAQQGTEQTPAPVPAQETAVIRQSFSEPAGNRVLGAEDKIGVWVQQSEEITRDGYEIDHNGEVHLPMVGRVPAAGLTVRQFEAELVERLRKYFRDPQASVTLNARNSQPVSIVGAVMKAGTYQLGSQRTLLEMLTVAGGLRADAGAYARITRSLENGRIPLRNALDDPGKRFSVADVNLRALLTQDSDENVELQPHDSITIPSAQTVYVIGEVPRQGSIPLSESQNMSVLQALSFAGGLSKTAAPSKARILRQIMGGPKRAELPVDLRRIMSGKSNDVPLMPHDILYVPDSSGRKVATRIAEAGVQVGMNMLTWGLVVQR